MDHTVLILCALLLNAVFAIPRRWQGALHIDRVATLPARAIRHLERKLNRAKRSREDLQVRGVIVVLAVFAAAVLVGVAGLWLFQHNLRFIELLLLASLLPVRPIWDRVTALRKALAANDLPAARQTLTGTVWKHHARLDAHGLARAAIELLTVEFSEKIVCPVLGYLLLGLPGFFVCKAITLLSDALAHAPDFGRGATLAHAALHTIPARLTVALWLVAACFSPLANVTSMARQVTGAFLNDGPRALCVRVASAVVHVSLGGPGSPYLSQWAKGGAPGALPADIRRAQSTYLLAIVFLFVLTGAFF